jgi:hypothetical protein
MRLDVILLGLALTVPTFASDATTNVGWDRLGQIPKTQRVRVNLITGQTHSGVIVAVGPESLTLLQDRTAVQVERKEIASVVRKMRLKGALIGGAIGGGIGVALGAGVAGSVLDTKSPNTSDRRYSAGGFGILMGGLGAAIGAVVGRQETLYSVAH